MVGFMNTKIVAVVVLLMIVAFILGYIIMRHKKATTPRTTSETHGQPKCEQHTCGAIDPVSAPEYNMKEVIQQSILLEDHLSNERKFCIDCITKHFLALIAYCNEALTLAGNKVDEFPFMSECPSMYEKMYQTWSHNKKDKEVRLDILTELREVRKKLMASYLA